MNIPLIEGALKVITEGVKYLTLLQKTSHVRRLRAAVHYGEAFILAFDKLVNEEDAGKKKRLRRRMEGYKRAFLRYNQG